MPLRDSELTQILFENFSKNKLALSILLNINCSKIPFVVLNPEKGEIDAIKRDERVPLEHVRIGPNRRLSLRENVRRSLKVALPQKVALVEVAEYDSQEKQICSRSVVLEDPDEFEWSDSGSCKSFLTHQPRKKPKKTKHKVRSFEEIEKVLNFGNNAKQITRTKLIQNPTIDDLKQSAIKIRKRKHDRFNLSKTTRVTRGKSRRRGPRAQKILQESQQQIDKQYLRSLEQFWENYNRDKNLLKMKSLVDNFGSMKRIRQEYSREA